MPVARWSRRGVAAVAALALTTGGLVSLPGSASAASGPLPIATIQGTARFTPYAGKTVTTTPSQVTAVYPSGRGSLNGFVIQTPGTGGSKRSLTKASDAIFVYLGTAAFDVVVGDLVSVTGTPQEFPNSTDPGADSLTELAGNVTIVKSTASYAKVKPITGISWARTVDGRENYESMLFKDTETFTVSNSFDLPRRGKLGLATGGLAVQPTDVAPYGSAKAKAQEGRNAARQVVLDDGTNVAYSLPYATTAGTPPFLTRKQDVKLGDTLTLDEPVIVDFRDGDWTFSPTRPTPAGEEIATLKEKPRESVPNVKGDVSVASFNVLNYFTTLGSGRQGCNPGPLSTDGTANVTYDCDARGAWDANDLQRQQTKIVKAVNALDASVVGLLEIENSAKVDGAAAKDEATRTLVAALNSAAGRTKWAYVPSSADLQPVADQDVITNALIFQPAEVRWAGRAYADGADAVDSGAFGNARTPIAASFAPAGGGEPILVVVNHYKSKGSGPSDATDPNADQGQGAWNAARVAQSKALLAWLPGVQKDARTDSVALVGDFNSYTNEDPLRTLYAAGYANAAAQGDYSYSFDGLSGSLDHVLLNAAATKRKTGSGVWNINSVEPTLREYSAYRTTAVDYYVGDAYRSSDHDPVLVGLKAGKAKEVKLTLLNFNDFHGRIAKSGPDTVAFFGTVEEERAAAGEDNTLLMSAGDSIGASLFTSSIQQDRPTIDVLNAAGLDVSAVGNHEFDKGLADLKGRVDRAADWTYLGANVYTTGTKTPVLPSYRVIERGGLRIGVIGAVTQETAALVSPDGIKGLTFGDPVEAVNRVANQLTDGKKSNGEADVLVAEYHEGAGAGDPPSNLAAEVAAGGAFANIVTKTSPKVAAIFTAHTHMIYAWDGPLPGAAAGATRPVVQSGSYAAKLGKVTLTVDTKTKKVTAYTRTNLNPTTTPDADLVKAYPRVAEISSIVNDAVAQADVLGGRVIGEATAKITRAAKSGSEDRGGESTLGNLVAQMYRQTLSAPTLGSVQIGVQNPGGVRADLDQGSITFKEAADVLPFANSLFRADLTGAQFKTLLEQQWQTDANGVPITGSRAYLQLGLSDNVAYTFDASRERGDRITSITVDGRPIDPTATYTVGTNSFLATGGDNFRVFRDGRNVRDTGLNDLQAWTDYITAETPISPSYAKHAVAVSPLPSTLTAGETTSFTVSSLDFTSFGGGDPQTEKLTVTLDGTEVGVFAVDGGQASVSLDVPDDATKGPGLLTLTTDSGTSVVVAVTVG